MISLNLGNVKTGKHQFNSDVPVNRKTFDVRTVDPWLFTYFPLLLLLPIGSYTGIIARNLTSIVHGKTGIRIICSALRIEIISFDIFELRCRRNLSR